MSILAVLASQVRYCLERSEVEKKIQYKVNDIVIDVHANIYKILFIGIEALHFNGKGDIVKEGDERASTSHIAYADLEIIKPTPLKEFGTLKRMLASDLWNTTHFQLTTVEDALRKHNAIRILYGC